MASSHVGLDGNFGWPCREGAHDTVFTDPGCVGVDAADPVLERTHGDDHFCAIVGGYVVRDPGLPTLLGRYVYGDNCNPALWSADLDDPSDDGPIGLSVPGLSSFGEDACGRALAVSLGGPVVEAVDAAGNALTLARGVRVRG